MGEETKETISILIHEVRGIINEHKPEDAIPKIQELLDSWVKANDLHPEMVKNFKTTGKWGTLVEVSVKLGPFVGVTKQMARRTRDGSLEIAALEAYQFKGRNIPASLGRFLCYMILTLKIGQVRESLGS